MKNILKFKIGLVLVALILLSSYVFAVGEDFNDFCPATFPADTTGFNVAENFEGAGTPTGWTSGGAPNYDYTNGCYEGSQCLLPDGGDYVKFPNASFSNGVITIEAMVNSSNTAAKEFFYYIDTCRFQFLANGSTNAYADTSGSLAVSAYSTNTYYKFVQVIDNINHNSSFYAYDTSGNLLGKAENRIYSNFGISGLLDYRNTNKFDNFLAYNGSICPYRTDYISSTLPVTNSQFNVSTISFNLTGNFSTGTTTNCSLYLNASINETKTGYPDGTNIAVNFSKNMADGSHSFYVFCAQANDTSQNATAITHNFYVDTVPPSATSNLDGNSTYFTGNISLGFVLTDNNLYSFNYSDSCGNSLNNASSLGTNLNFNFYSLNCSVGQKSANVTLCDGFTSTLNCVRYNYLFNNMAMLNLTVFNALTNISLVLNFSVYLNGTILGNSTDGYYTINNLSIGSYNFTIDAPGFALGYATINITNTTNFYNFSLYTTNSISFTIKDETTGNLILQNVTIKLSNNISELSNVTATGHFYIDNINASVYSLLFTSSGYSPRTYIITVGNRTTQSLDVYLTHSNLTTLFTFMDRDSSELLENCLITMYKQINGSWTTVESGYSDITGRAQFIYTAYTNYKFYVSKDEYEDYVFYLSPILFSSYDVKMSKISLSNYSLDFDMIAIIYGPQMFQNNNQTTFTFIISSPTGLLTNYGINLTYPGGANGTTGVNAIGKQFDLKLNISGASVFDVVTLTYYYTTTTSGLRTFTVNMPITFPTGSGYSFTMIRNRDITFGMGDFERYLISVLIVIFITGIASLIGQPLPGFALGLLIYGLLCYIGFISFWSLSIPMLIGIIFLIWRSSQ